MPYCLHSHNRLRDYRSHPYTHYRHHSPALIPLHRILLNRYQTSYRHHHHHRMTCCLHSHSRLQGYRSHPYTRYRHHSQGLIPLHRNRLNRYQPSYRHHHHHRMPYCCIHTAACRVTGIIRTHIAVITVRRRSAYTGAC